jgi:hypothetical protein
MPSATASPEETNEHVRSAPMEFEVAHSVFPESRVLASYPSSILKAQMQSSSARFCKFFATPV